MASAASINDILHQLLIASYGAHMTPEQGAALRPGLAQLEQTAQTLRRYPLSMADEPLPLFAAYRAERD